MRFPGRWSLLLAAGSISGVAHADPSAASAPVAPAPDPAPPEPPAPSAPEPAALPASPQAATEGTTTSASETVGTTAPPAGPATAPTQVRAEETKPVGVSSLAEGDPTQNLARDFSALPLTLEARFGFNARLGSSFAGATDEEHWGPSYAFASYLAWRPEFALGVELDHSGLGRVRALTDQTSVDNEYSATGAWLAARVFPIRRERFDFFLNFRVGMVWQHVDALGTRAGMSITQPAQSYTCGVWDGPGIGLGGALGTAYRLGRHVSLVSRLELNGERLNGGALGTCADGIGSVATLGGSVGLAFEFETAPK